MNAKDNSDNAGTLSLRQRLHGRINEILSLIKSSIHGVLQTVSQVLLLSSSSAGFFLYRLLTNPTDLLGLLAMFISDKGQYVACAQLLVSALAFLVSRGFKKMNLVTKILFLLNTFIAGLHIKLTKQALDSVNTFQQTLEANSLDTSLFKTSYINNPNSKPSRSSPMANLLSAFNLSAFTTALISLAPSIANPNPLRLTKKTYKTTKENIDHHQPVESKSYADMNEVDPSLAKDGKALKTDFSRLMTLARGRVSEWLDLDIFRNNDILASVKSGDAKKFPVIVHIHGGAWMLGDKIRGCPGMLDFVMQNYNIIVVKVNYRMAPERTMAECLLDSKRALAWVRNNISTYGGDPQQICASGESAGGHLTAMAALTNNLEKYRHLFLKSDSPELLISEDEFNQIARDSKIQLAVDIAGVHDITKNADTAKFAEPLMHKKYKDFPEDFDDMSPTKVLLKKLSEEAAEDDIPPMMFIHGTKDVLADLDDAKEFYEVLKRFRFQCGGESRQKKDVFVEIEGAHHVQGNFTSPRATAMGLGVASFLKTHFTSVTQIANSTRL